MENEIGYKVVYVCRNDLNMRKGKLAAQVGHATMQLIINETTGKQIEKWAKNGYKKIVLGATLEEIKEIRESVFQEDEGIPITTVYDDGLTDVLPRTLTCIAIGPDYEDVIDQFTGALNLL